MPQFPWKTSKCLCLPKLSPSLYVILILIIYVFVFRVAGWNRARVPKCPWKTLLSLPTQTFLFFFPCIPVVGSVFVCCVASWNWAMVPQGCLCLPRFWSSFFLIFFDCCVASIILGKDATVSLRDAQESLFVRSIIIHKYHHNHDGYLLCGWLKLGKGATMSL